MQSTTTTIKLGQVNETMDPNKALESRAARFGLVTAGATVTSDDKKAARAARFGDISKPTPNPVTTSPQQQATSNLSDAEKAKQLRAARFGGIKPSDDAKRNITKSLGNRVSAKVPEPPREEDPVKLARAARFAQTKLN